MKWLQSRYLASFRQAVGRALPTLGTALAGVAAGVVLVISCNMGPSISMADGTTGGAASGGSSGGSAGGGTSGGSTGGSGGSCDCSFSGPVTLAGPVTVSGPVTNVSASEDSAQLVSGQLSLMNATTAPGAFDCTAIAKNGSVNVASSGASCIKLVDGPFVLTDLSTPSTQYSTETWLFAAPPSATWTSSTQAQWFVAQFSQYNSPQSVVSATGMHYVVPAGSSLYAISSEADPIQPSILFPVSFSWSGFVPYH